MTVTGHDRRVGRLKNLVGFELADVHYAMEIGRVSMIIHPLPLVALPHAPPSIVGVADHRGAVVPVIDVRTRLGLSKVEPTRRTRWVVVDSRIGRVAFVVDAVSDVFGTQPDEQRAVPSIGVGDEQRAFTAVYATQGRLVFVVDVDRIAEVAQSVDVELGQRLLGGGT